ncbi:hypothetical protein [Bacillus pseudomycoides]|uniref:Uncharacterized protein n=1 Tax=Bacillus pseudomycoides TaxID=64104 RepID=A0A2B5QL28_9BACI|nr:hypothetical protein [Bacillus pseudomycoides]PEA82952.1 hypothetical protein CON99_14320 [Bacillus pseudomycoides]PED69499.1 hypothetical protein CON97_24870 [Bacillus pseudomycoides]PEI34040.1 hypothetical protein CN620_26785 [Bacillus pseudomycoides]PEJ72538.1 hypothetical protein CN680_21685 [Bacillus pseudomycoides]PEM10713.1 hypothetical protein CN628_22345 [Bacillus pseudomycoides]
MFNYYINAKDTLFYKKRFYNVLASISFVFISVIGMYLLDVELMYFVIVAGIAIMTLLIQLIYYYSNWKKSLK